MSRPSLETLASRLDLPVASLAVLEACTDDELAVLDEAVALAVMAEDQAVEHGLDAAVRFVPRPLRGRARKLVFGSERG
ncbi:hypothetical protein [Nocardioides alkalitolerans]|uniref:hypothetical protein n=1 Tax=Nocardioides alkalitolerans TaxID=281714 RepID=UPI0012F7D775|nr:hypothetical protein [Nocardioides alkalitolerans]